MPTRPRLEIGFAVPAVFIALLIPSIVDRPAVIAAGVAGVVAVAASGLPNGLNIITAALCGIATARVHTLRPAEA